MHRLFVALRPSPALRASLLDLMDGIPGVRWQDDEQLHLTLCFIGEIERPVAEDVAAALARVDGPRPTVSIQGVGTFARRGAVHTLFARVAPDPGLLALRKRVERALTMAGAAPEHRAFLPHVTLARLSRSAAPCAAFIARHAAFTTKPELVASFGLFESSLGRDGARYELAADYPLR